MEISLNKLVMLHNDSNFEYEWELDYGCYTFNIYDTYGDGLEASIWGNYVDGFVTLNDENNDFVVMALHLDTENRLLLKLHQVLILQNKMELMSFLIQVMILQI